MDIIKSLKWTYIAVLYSDDDRGRQGYDDFRNMSEKVDGFCIDLVQMISPGSSNDVIIERLVRTFGLTNDSLGVVYIGQAASIISLLESMSKDSRVYGVSLLPGARFHWIMTENVGTNPEVAGYASKIHSEVITLTPTTIELAEFKDYFVQVLNESQFSKSIYEPWIFDYMKSVHNCELHADVRPCSLLIGDIKNSFIQGSYITNAIDTFLAMATVVKQAQIALCNDISGICDKLKTFVSNDMLYNVSLFSSIYKELDKKYIPEEYLMKNWTFSFKSYDGGVDSADTIMYSIQKRQSLGYEKVCIFYYSYNIITD